MPAIELVYLTSADCHLCEHGRRTLAELGDEFAVEVREVSWDSDDGEGLLAGLALFPPAVFHEGRLLGYGRLSARALRRKLEEVSA